MPRAYSGPIRVGAGRMELEVVAISSGEKPDKRLTIARERADRPPLAAADRDRAGLAAPSRDLMTSTVLPAGRLLERYPTLQITPAIADLPGRPHPQRAEVRGDRDQITACSNGYRSDHFGRAVREFVEPPLLSRRANDAAAGPGHSDDAAQFEGAG